MNSQDCDEYVRLLEEFGAGVSVPAFDMRAFRDALFGLLDSKQDIEIMREGAIRLGQGPLSRTASHMRVLGLIESELS